MAIDFRYTVVALLLIIFNVQAQEDQKITTVEWQCYSQLDYLKGESSNNFSRSNVLVNLSRTTEGNASNGTGTVTIGGITFQGTFEIHGLDRVWRYKNSGQIHKFVIGPSGYARVESGPRLRCKSS